MGFAQKNGKAEDYALYLLIKCQSDELFQFLFCGIDINWKVISQP